MFSATKFSDFMECLIPFFDKYQIIPSRPRPAGSLREGVKYEDYLEFKKVAQLMEKKAHLTIEGLEDIRRIKSKMNRGRPQDDEEEGYFTK